MKKHQALQAELVGHEARINAVCEQGGEMVTEEHFAADVIQQKITALQERWNQLRVRVIWFHCGRNILGFVELGSSVVGCRTRNRESLGLNPLC